MADSETYILDAPLGVIRPFLLKKPSDLEFVEDTAADLRRALDRVSLGNLDVGFCHGDCHGCNVPVNEGSLIHFDFDCCGFGYRVFELATFKWGVRGNDNESGLWSLFLEGYRSRREPGAEDLDSVDLFIEHVVLTSNGEWRACRRLCSSRSGRPSSGFRWPLSARMSRVEACLSRSRASKSPSAVATDPHGT